MAIGMLIYRKTKKYNSMRTNTLLSGILLLAASLAVQAAPRKAIPFSLAGKKVQVVTTAQGSDKPMQKGATLTFENCEQPTEKEIAVFVSPGNQYQSLFGIGGAITDASAEVFAQMPADMQKAFLRSYYDKNEGLGYSLLRTTIQSSDFSSETYSYVTKNDSLLNSFSIQHDLKYRVPMIKQALQIVGSPIPVYASPWSPPAWMKSNESMLQGGKLLPRYYQSWANFYIRFIKAYEALGIKLWGVSVQNEPMATQTWESCIFTGKEEANYIKRYLGPTLVRNGMQDKKIIAWDHNRDLMFQRATDVYSDPEAAKYIWGIGFHWYETWSKGKPMYENVKLVNEAFPQKNLMFTEGCIEKFNYSQLKDWWLGERYGEQMINDFNNGACGWTDWNILLDENGGPNHAGNFCFSPVHFNTHTKELIYDNAFYYIGHFSKYIRPGARRLATSTSRSCLQATSFLNTNGKLVVVVMNNSDKDYDYMLWIHGKAAKTTSTAHSISSLIVD